MNKGICYAIEITDELSNPSKQVQRPLGGQPVPRGAKVRHSLRSCRLIDLNRQLAQIDITQETTLVR